MSVALIICNVLAKGYGDTVLAGMGVAAKIMFIGTFIFMGFAAGCQPLVGFNFGAKNFKRVNAIIKNSMAITLGIGVVLVAVFVLFAEFFVGIFTPISEVITQGGIALRIHAWSFLVIGPQMLASTTIQAFGKAKESLILSIARQGLFFIPLLFLLNSLYAYKGLMWAQPISDLITLVLGIILLIFILKKYEKTNTDISPINTETLIQNGLVITISREHGSGGREIGHKVATALSIPCFDKKIIDLTALKSGIEKTEIANYEESFTNDSSYSAYYTGSVFAIGGTPENDSIFTTQSAIIKELAASGSCVIIGRCSNSILEKYQDTFHIFIHSSLDERKKRIVAEYGVAQKDTDEVIRVNDTVRAYYVKHYTGQVFGDSANYDLMIDSGKFGIDGSVSLILDAIKTRNDRGDV